MSSGPKILIVEDNDFVRMQIAQFLSAEVREIVEATDGDDAEEKLNEHDDIDIAIVDVRMEPTGGFEFIRLMRSADIFMPVILVTGDQSPELLTDASKLGVFAVLMKPVERDRLVKTVSKAVQTIGRA